VTGARVRHLPVLAKEGSYFLTLPQAQRSLRAAWAIRIFPVLHPPQILTI